MALRCDLRVGAADDLSDPQWIAKTLRPKITAKKAEEALDTLLNIGLLTTNADGEIEPVHEWMMPDEGTLDVALMNFYELTPVIQQFNPAFWRQHRIALGFTGSLPKNRIAELEEKMMQTFSEMASNCESDPREVVVQMNFVLFPLSDPGSTTWKTGCISASWVR